MSIVTKRGLRIILIALILVLSSGYILKSGSQKFAMLDVDKVNNINDPAIKTVVEVTEKCNKLKEPYNKFCYKQPTENLGYYHEHIFCEKLKKELRQSCYFGFGKKVGEENAQRLDIIVFECSKSEDNLACLSGASRVIGQGLLKQTEAKLCENIPQQGICYEGFGRGLAEENKDLGLCEKILDKESCLLGYSFKIGQKGNIEKALQICQSLSDEGIVGRCYSFIGLNDYIIYNKTIEDSFKDCEQYPYPENCKYGVAWGVASKFFSENQQKDKTFIPVTFAIYKTINPPVTKISLIIKQQLIPHFINYKLVYLQIILSSLVIIVAIRVLKIKKVQETIKKAYTFSTKKLFIIYNFSIKKLIITYRFLTKKLITIYKELKLVIQDLLSIDKTTITSFFKELKTELRSKEGKKKLLSISSIGVLILIASAGGVTLADYSVLPEDLNETLPETTNNLPIIESYTPEQDTITILTNESQAFTITASDPDNDLLSIQWYVNNLAIADRISETFEYQSSEPGEYEIKVLITDNKGYTTHKWVLTIQPEEIAEPEPIENITEPVNETQEMINETEVMQPEVIENLTEPANETIEITEDDQLIQLPAEINKPVKWIRTIVNENQTTQLKIRLPKSATNIKAKKIILLISEEIQEEIPSEKILVESPSSPTGFTIAALPSRESYVSRFFKFLKNLFRFTGFVTAEIETKEITIDETAAKYEVSYETPAPEVKEKKLDDGKRITIYSDISYENVLAYTVIEETKQEMIKFYWVQETGREPFENVSYIDTNDNGLIDKLEWTVPHLSEQTFEVEITIINVQSYPTVGGNWTVMFTTNGEADLTIKAIDGTTWSNANEDNDLKFLEIRCGEQVLDYTWIDNSVFVEDYTCSETGYEVSKVLTGGEHSLEFTFGDETAYAYNDASTCPGCWYVKDKTGTSIMEFSKSTGILQLEGLITSQAGTVAALTTIGAGGTVSNGPHLIFRNNSDAGATNNENIIAWINMSGDFNLAGSNMTGATCAQPNNNSFMIKDDTGAVKMYIDISGNLCTTGVVKNDHLP